MNIQLSDHFTYKKLFRFTMPSVVMMIFSSIYGVVDGFFVSNYAGMIPFAAVNFIMPFLMILGAIGFMFGTGGSALVAISMGEGDTSRANRLFSLFVYATIIIGAVISVLGIIFIKNVAMLLGATGEMLDYCVVYGRIILISLVPFMIQMEFQSFFVAAEKPQLGLVVTVIAGVCNMVLDALFVGVFGWGIEGAAWATAVSQIVGGGTSVLYFVFPNSSKLYLCKTSYDGGAMMRACTNGSSELLTNISMSVVSILYNMQLMKYQGEVGVAAYGVLMYVNFVFLSAFIGYSVGTAPVFGYHFGAENTQELKNLLKKSLTIVGICSVVMFVAAECLASPLSMTFSGEAGDMYKLTVTGFYTFSFSFLFAGLSIFGSAFFTALGNGLVSAVISFLRTLVFQVAAVMILPVFFGTYGIWMSIVVAEFMAFVVTIRLLVVMRKNYNY